MLTDKEKIEAAEASIAQLEADVAKANERAGQLKAQLDDALNRYETLRLASRAQARAITFLLDVAGVDAQA